MLLGRLMDTPGIGIVSLPVACTQCGREQHKGVTLKDAFPGIKITVYDKL